VFLSIINASTLHLLENISRVSHPTVGLNLRFCSLIRMLGFGLRSFGMQHNCRLINYAAFKACPATTAEVAVGQVTILRGLLAKNTLLRFF